MVDSWAWRPCAHIATDARRRALDLVGERWALLVARELLLGPKRFTDLRAAYPRRAPTSSPSAWASWRGRGWCGAASFSRLWHPRSTS
jgi:hypothetical protein